MTATLRLPECTAGSHDSALRECPGGAAAPASLCAASLSLGRERLGEFAGRSSWPNTRTAQTGGRPAAGALRNGRRSSPRSCVLVPGGSWEHRWRSRSFTRRIDFADLPAFTEFGKLEVDIAGLAAGFDFVVRVKSSLNLAG